MLCRVNYYSFISKSYRFSGESGVFQQRDCDLAGRSTCRLPFRYQFAVFYKSVRNFLFLSLICLKWLGVRPVTFLNWALRWAVLL